MTALRARNRGPRPLLLALLASLAAGCAVGDEKPAATASDDAGDRELHGRIAHLTVSTRNTLGRDDVPVSVAAQFVEFAGVETRSVRRSLDLWTPPSELVDGECVLRDEATMLDPRDWYSSRIDLLHAGTLHVASPAAEVALSPRPMPDLLPYLGGYTYGTDARNPLRYEPELPLALWSEGGDAVGGFGLELELPPPISLAYVGGQAVGSAAAVDVDLGGDLLVLWEPAGSDELVYLLVEEDGVDPGPRLTCVAFDDGGFRLSRDALELLRSEGARGRLRLTLRRARVADLGLPDFDRAEAVAITEHAIVLY
jgi:hypothetical protein